MIKDYYAILGISSNANAAEIKLAYRNLAKKFHPDIIGEDPEKQQYFNDIKLAYETLTQPNLKYAYLEKRWLFKSEGQTFTPYEPTTVNSILKDMIALEKQAYYMDSSRNNEEIIAIKLGEILSTPNIELLEKVKDLNCNEQIVIHVIKLIPYIPIDYLPNSTAKIKKINVENNKQKMESWNLAIKKRVINYKLEKYKWLYVLALMVFLLVVIWQISR